MANPFGMKEKLSDYGSQFESHRSVDINGVSPTLSSTTSNLGGLLFETSRTPDTPLPYSDAIRCLERL